MLIMGRSIATNAMRFFFVVGFLLLFSTWGGHAVHAQPATGAAPHIEWEVKNRFRLFRNEADFQHHVAAAHSGGVLAAERRRASATAAAGRATQSNGCASTARAGSWNSAIATGNARAIWRRATTPWA